MLRNCLCTHLQKSNHIKWVVKNWITLVSIQTITQARGTKGLWYIFRFTHYETLPTFRYDIRNNLFRYTKVLFKRHFYCLVFVIHTNYFSGHLRSNLIGKTIYTNKRECFFVDLYIFKINDNPYLRLSNMLILCLVKWNVYELQKYDSYSYHYDLAPLVLIIRHFVMKCQWRSMCYEMSMKINVF